MNKNNRKISVAETLTETLQQYVSDVEYGDHDPFYDDYIVDCLCDMSEVLANDEVVEGSKYQSFLLITNQPVKIYETIKVGRALSGKKNKIKVMSITDVQLTEGGDLFINFLGLEVRD